MNQVKEKSMFCLHTATGNEYEFEMQAVDNVAEFVKQLGEEAGIFLFLRYDTDGNAIPYYVYCAASDNIGKSLASCNKIAEIENAGTDKFCFYPEPSELVRNEVIKDIRDSYKFAVS